MKKNKKILIIVIVLILMIVGGTTAIVLLNDDNNKEEQKEEQKIEVLLNDNLKFEINSEIKLLSLVSKDNKAEIISEDETIDTSSLGEKELVIKYKDKDKEKEHKFKINIVDTTQPTIEAENELSTTQGTEIDLLKNVKVSDNSKEEIKATIEGNYDFNNEGTYNLKYVAVDSSNNKVEKEFVLKVNKKKTTTSSNTNKNNSNNSTSNKNNTTSNSQSSDDYYYSEEVQENGISNEKKGEITLKKMKIAQEYIKSRDKLYDYQVEFSPVTGTTIGSYPYEFYWYWSENSKSWQLHGHSFYYDEGLTKMADIKPTTPGTIDGQKGPSRTYYILESQFKVPYVPGDENIY